MKSHPQPSAIAGYLLGLQVCTQTGLGRRSSAPCRAQASSCMLCSERSRSATAPAPNGGVTWDFLHLLPIADPPRGRGGGIARRDDQPAGVFSCDGCSHLRLATAGATLANNMRSCTPRHCLAIMQNITPTMARCMWDRGLSTATMPPPPRHYKSDVRTRCGVSSQPPSWFHCCNL